MPISRRLLLVASVLATPGVIPAYLLYRATTQPGSDTSGTMGMPPALEESKLSKILNPRGNPSLSDSWTYTVPRSQIRPLLLASKPELSEEDEERIILARFVHGFFGGKAFAFEHWLFSTFTTPIKKYLSLGLTDPSNTLLNASHPDDRVFWSASQWPKDDYAPYGAIYVNGFTLLDCGRDRIYADDRLPRTFSAVAFGSNLPGARFVGVHFFSVNRRRDPSRGDKDDVVFDLNLWSTNCDPSEHGVKPRSPQWLWKYILPNFHYVYQRALVGDGIDSVRRG